MAYSRTGDIVRLEMTRDEYDTLIMAYVQNEIRSLADQLAAPASSPVSERKRT